ncbi:MAG TPA: hypothetical protein VLI04_18465 [Nocardioidaceae bacterium]|nr:hypothetical protein [Nocardioidaceae bacterium]
MPPRNQLLALLALVEAFVGFALLFAFAADSRPLLGVGAVAGTVVLCIVALRLIGIETYGWLPERVAVFLLGGFTALGLVFVVTR